MADAGGSPGRRRGRPARLPPEGRVSESTPPGPSGHSTAPRGATSTAAMPLPNNTRSRSPWRQRSTPESCARAEITCSMTSDIGRVGLPVGEVHMVTTHEPDPDHDLVHVDPSSHLRPALEVDDVEASSRSRPRVQYPGSEPAAPWTVVSGRQQRAAEQASGLPRRDISPHLKKTTAPNPGALQSRWNPAYDQRSQFRTVNGPYHLTDMIREGRIRNASLTSRRNGISPVPSRFGCRVCIATTSGSGTCSSKTSSHVITRSRPGSRRTRQLSIVVLPACVPPATRMFSPAATAASRNRAACARQRAEPRRGRPGASADHELADVDAQCVAGDVGDDDVQPASRRAASRRRTACDRSIRRPEVFSIRSTRSRTSSAVRIVVVSSAAPAAGDEHLAGLVDPDLLHRGVVEEGLERRRTRPPRQHALGRPVQVGQGRQATVQGPLVVVGDRIAHQLLDRGRVLERVDPRAAMSSRTSVTTFSTAPMTLPLSSPPSPEAPHVAPTWQRQGRVKGKRPAGEPFHRSLCGQDVDAPSGRPPVDSARRRSARPGRLPHGAGAGRRGRTAPTTSGPATARGGDSVEMHLTVVDPQRRHGARRADGARATGVDRERPGPRRRTGAGPTGPGPADAVRRRQGPVADRARWRATSGRGRRPHVHTGRRVRFPRPSGLVEVHVVGGPDAGCRPAPSAGAAPRRPCRRGQHQDRGPRPLPRARRARGERRRRAGPRPAVDQRHLAGRAPCRQHAPGPAAACPAQAGVLHAPGPPVLGRARGRPSRTGRVTSR